MAKFLDGMKEIQNYTTTENGAVALKSTGNAMLDAFGSLGAMKDSSEDDILRIFNKAFAEAPNMAMKLLFYIRDIRGGQGMRRVFRVIISHLAYTHPEVVIANFENILFFGRGDDYLCLLDTPVEKDVIKYINEVINDDLKLINCGQPCSLLGKWLPSENASSTKTKQYARKLIKGLGLTPRAYRKILSILRKNIGIVELYMSQNEWDKIAFSNVPSRASMIYSDAFEKHCLEQYIKYLKEVAVGNAKINAAALFPVDIIHKILNCYTPNIKDKYLFEGMWNALPNYLEGIEETGICVVDTSGSMWGTPIEVALSLGIYCADKCKGPFKNHFITFSENPQLQEIIGETIVDKVRNMEAADWGMNTNLEAVFDLILETAVSNHLDQSELPSKLYIISDMQFDACVYTSAEKNVYNKHTIRSTFMDEMEAKFAKNGYTLPAIVYWNVRQSNCGMFQKKFNGRDCCMVSGYSPSLFKAIIEGTEYIEEVASDGTVATKQVIDPITVMNTTLNNPRYDRVVYRVD